MQIRIQSDGGVGYFPGLAEPMIIDTARLPADEGSRLESMVGTAAFFDRPSAVGSHPPTGADMRRYSITVDDDGGRSHTVDVTEPVDDPALLALITALREAGAAARDH